MKRTVGILILVLLLAGCSSRSRDHIVPKQTIATQMESSNPDISASVMGKLEAVHGDSEMTDSQRVQKIIGLFFDVWIAQISAPDVPAFDYDAFWHAEPETPASLEYYELYIEARKDRFLSNDLYASDASVQLKFKNVEISNDCAYVEVYVWTEYKCRSLHDDTLVPPSTDGTFTGEGITYTFVMEKMDGQWFISSIDFYDETTVDLKDEVYEKYK